MDYLIGFVLIAFAFVTMPLAIAGGFAGIMAEKKPNWGWWRLVLPWSLLWPALGFGLINYAEVALMDGTEQDGNGGGAMLGMAVLSFGYFALICQTILNPIIGTVVYVLVRRSMAGHHDEEADGQ